MSTFPLIKPLAKKSSRKFLPAILMKRKRHPSIPLHGLHSNNLLDETSNQHMFNLCIKLICQLSRHAHAQHVLTLLSMRHFFNINLII